MKTDNETTHLGRKYKICRCPYLEIGHNIIDERNKNEAKADAELIVKAVNNYDALVAFAKRVSCGQFGELKGEFIVNIRNEAKQLLDQLK